MKTLRASQFSRYAACPGSLNAENELPQPPDNPDSARGTRIHAWLAAKVRQETLPDLNDDELATAETLWEKADVGHLSASTAATEASLDYMGGAITGHPDLMYLDEQGNVHIDDYKSGFWTRRESADNAQLRVYAVMVYWNLPKKNRPPAVIVRLITPDHKPNTPTIYTVADIQAAGEEIEEIYDACCQQDAPRHAGPHCRYCLACGHPDRCPESCNLPAEVGAMLPILSAEQAVALLSPEKLVNLWGMKKAVKKVFDLIDAEIKSRLEAGGDSVPGLQLRNTGKTRQVTDPLEAYKRMDMIPEDAFWKACKVSLTDLEEEYRNAIGGTKKAATEAVKAALDGLVEEKPKSPTIEES